MNIGLDHEGIGPHFLGRLRFQPVAFVDDRLIDLVDGLGTQQIDVPLDPPPIEFLYVLLLALPVADPHEFAQGVVVLGEILELVVVVIAPQPHRREDKDFPVAQTWPPVLGLDSPLTSRAMALRIELRTLGVL